MGFLGSVLSLTRKGRLEYKTIRKKLEIYIVNRKFKEYRIGLKDIAKYGEQMSEDVYKRQILHSTKSSHDFVERNNVVK